MKKLTIIILTPLLLWAISLPSIELGDKAPTVSPTEWIKGDLKELNFGDGKTIYVIDVWGSYCKPCKESIAHLTKLQKKYKNQNVVVVGLSDEDAETVKKYVAQMGKKMEYNIAIDGNHQMFDSYLKPFNVKLIPHTFIINQHGCIIWHGHPMDKLEGVIEELITHNFDIQRGRKMVRVRQLIFKYLQQAYQNKQNESRNIGIKIFQEFANEPEMLNEFAWVIITDKKIKTPDYQLAFFISKTAYIRSHGKDPIITDTYSNTLFLLGEIKQAIKLQKQAIKLIKDNDILRTELQKNLEKFQKKLKEENKKKKQATKQTKK